MSSPFRNGRGPGRNRTCARAAHSGIVVVLANWLGNAVVLSIFFSPHQLKRIPATHPLALAKIGTGHRGFSGIDRRLRAFSMTRWLFLPQKGMFNPFSTAIRSADVNGGACDR